MRRSYGGLLCYGFVLWGYEEAMGVRGARESGVYEKNSRVVSGDEEGRGTRRGVAMEQGLGWGVVGKDLCDMEDCFGVEGSFWWTWMVVLGSF